MNARRTRITIVALLVAPLILYSSRSLVAEDPASNRVFRAGAYAIDITSQHYPVESAGSMTPRVVHSAHDPLHARCLVLDDGQTKIAFAICDSCMIPREIFDRAKEIASRETGIPIDHILTSATHTHTGVSAAPTFQSKVEEEYCEYLIQRIAEGIIQAAAQLEPARVGWAVGNNGHQVFNRRWHMREGFPLADPFDSGRDRVRMNPPPGDSKLLKPAGPIDPEVPVLAVQSRDGRPIAVLANYAMHYVGGVPKDVLSADYFGQFAVELANRIDATSPPNRDAPPFVAIMTNGTSADVNNTNFFEGSPAQQPFAQIRLVAADVADSALAAYKRIEWHDWAPISMRETEIELGVRRPTVDDKTFAKEVLSKAGDPPFKTIREIYALETLAMAEYPPTVRAKLQAIRIGDLGIVSSPCETFVETGMAIKRESPLRPTFTIELANGYNGYLPTPEQHALGGYETWRAKSSYLAVDAEPQIRAKLLEMLNELAAEKTTANE